MTLAERLKRVRILLLDVDGVLTDGRIILNDDGVQTKFFDVTDGHGIKMLQRAGIPVGIVTGRQSRVVEVRAKELSIREVHQKTLEKLPVVREILARRGLSPEEACYVGDDIVDLPVLLQVGAAVTVPGASEEVRSRVHWVTTKPGGGGAVREVCDAILKATGRWDDLTRKYFEPEKL